MTRGRTASADVLIVGGGLGGVAAALAAVRRGATVILTEESPWLGGALTTQAAPPDEHRLIEHTGAPASYRAMRATIRDLYRRWYPLSPAARRRRYLNPGGGWVSPLCVEPRVARLAIDCMLASHVAVGRLSVWTCHRPVMVDVERARVRSVTLATNDGSVMEFAGTMVIDATEEGDLLPLAGVEYVTGSEAVAETGEPHASADARPANTQAVTHAFAVEHRRGEDHTIDRPREYDHWRRATLPGWPGPLLDWTFPDPRTLGPIALPFDPNPEASSDSFGAHAGDRPADRDLWRYRRILARNQFAPGMSESDVSVINWPMNDYAEGTTVDVDPATRQARLDAARSLSASLLYWLQCEAPRPDGGTGWPGLRLREDLLGTKDGFAMRPYIRESRRIRAEVTVTESDIARDVRGRHGATRYADTVGVGAYRLDLHPTTGGDTYLDVEACPFEIPLGALIPQRLDNMLAGAKNIGSTHISNGCYRLHPVEWSIGEAAGAIASAAVASRTTPRAIRSKQSLLESFQRDLVRDGAQLRWSEADR
jgi:hypothetical protein